MKYNFTIYGSEHCQKEYIAEYPLEHRITSPDELLRVVQNDTIFAKCKGNHRAEANYIEQDCVAQDLDNSHSEDEEDWKTLDDVAETFPDVVFIYSASRHDNVPKKKGDVIYAPRLKKHLYFPLSKKLTSYEEGEILAKKICCLFPYFDGKCLDPVHFFYGVKDTTGGEYDGELFIDEYIENEWENNRGRFTQTVIEFEKEFNHNKECDGKCKTLFEFLGIPFQGREAFTPANAGELTPELKQKRKWLEDFLTKNGVEHKESRSNPLTFEVPCFNSAEHTEEGSPAYVFVAPDGRFCYKCYHEHCLGLGWKAFRKAVEIPSEDEKRIEKQYAEHKATAKNTAETTEKTHSREVKMFTPISAKALQQAQLKPIKYIVKDSVPTGLTVIGAPPKSGKSWLMLQLCLAVSKGVPFLGFETIKTSALYLALEDGDNFEQDRMNKQLAGEEAPDNFFYVFKDVATMDGGLMEQLDATLQGIPDLGLVVIDTLAMVKHQQKRQESAYECDYRTGKELKEWADLHDIAVVVVTHTTKMIHPEDPFSNINGTMGVTGTADAVMVLVRKERFDRVVTLAVTGRRVPMNQYSVTWDEEIFQWNMIGATDSKESQEEQRKQEYMESDIRRAVLEIAKHEQSWKGSAGQIIEKAANDYEIYITTPKKETGGFLCHFGPFFGKYDSVSVRRIAHGNAGSEYRIENKFKPVQMSFEELTQ